MYHLIIFTSDTQVKNLIYKYFLSNDFLGIETNL